MGKHSKPEEQEDYEELRKEYNAMIANGLVWKAMKLGRRLKNMERQRG